MKPASIAHRLRLIADGIDGSRSPSREIAIDNMKKIRAALEEEEPEPEPGPELDPDAESGILLPQTEYSIQLDLALTADFEGSTDRQGLVKKFKDELVAALKSSMSITARELGLTATGARVQPINIDCAVTEPEPEPEPEPE
jgi:hypothetical protein